MKQSGLILVPVMLFALLIYSTVGIFSLILKHDTQRIAHRVWFYKQNIELRSALRYSQLFFEDIPVSTSQDPEWYFSNQGMGFSVDWFSTPINLFKTDTFIYAITSRTPYRSILKQAYTIEDETLILHYIETLNN
jgi:hypothetical protein